MITVIYYGKEYTFSGDELTSATSKALVFLKEQQEKEMVV